MSEKPAFVPPHSVEAEQAVLGGLMLDRVAWVEVGDIITSQAFYRPDHQLIFDAIAALADADKACDLVTVAEELTSRDMLKEAGGMAYLGTLTRDTPGAANIRAYANIVLERANRRHLILCGRELVALGQLGFEREELDLAQQQVLDLTTERVDHGFKPITELFAAQLDEISSRADRRSHLVGPSCGFSAIDKYSLGLEPGTLMLVAARPSVGKTALVSAMLEHVAIEGKLAAAMFSLEMSTDQLTSRFVASNCRIPLTAVRNGQLTDPQWVETTRVMKLIHGAPLYIDDEAGLTIGELRARARRLKHRLAREGRPLVAIAVDYVQLLNAPGLNANERTGNVSKGLKALAKELGLCVIALSQLTRESEKREDKRPLLSDLRDSGSLEQDADLVIFLWRKEGPENGVRPGDCAKNRNGPTGPFALSFVPEYTRFESLDSQRELDWWDQEREQKQAKFKKPPRAVSPDADANDKRTGASHD